MGEVTCTLLYKDNNRRDLVLPDNIPVHLLVKSIALALGLPTGDRLFYELLVQEDQGFVRIQSTKTLQQAFLTNGTNLKLSLEVDEKNNTAFLLANNNVNFRLRENTVIGRLTPEGFVDVDLTLLDTKKVVSRRHAIISRIKDRYLIKDANSRNGTFVNGVRIADGQSVTLRPKDVIHFGSPKTGVKVVLVYE